MPTERNRSMCNMWPGWHNWTLSLWMCSGAKVLATLLYLRILDTIFGIPNVDNDIIINAFNVGILYAKYYVYKCKIKSLHFCFEEIQIHLRYRLEYEK